MLVSQLMTRDPISVGPHESVSAVVELMECQNIRHIPVVDDQGYLVGMVSDRDVKSQLTPFFQDAPEEGEEALDEEATTSSVMTMAPMSIPSDSNAFLAAELMIEYRVSAIPVTGDDGRLIGIVSYIDLLRHYVDLCTGSTLPSVDDAIAPEPLHDALPRSN